MKPIDSNIPNEMRHFFILGTYQITVKVLVDPSWVFN